jgi:hypothetical protein
VSRPRKVRPDRVEKWVEMDFGVRNGLQILLNEGRSLRDLVAMSGVPLSTLYRFMHNEGKISLENAEKLLSITAKKPK